MICDHNVILLEGKLVSTLFLSKRSEKGKKRKTGNSAIKQENDNHAPWLFVASFSVFRNCFTEIIYFNLKETQDLRGGVPKCRAGDMEAR